MGAAESADKITGGVSGAAGGLTGIISAITNLTSFEKFCLLSIAFIIIFYIVMYLKIENTTFKKLVAEKADREMDTDDFKLITEKIQNQ